MKQPVGTNNRDMLPNKKKETLSKLVTDVSFSNVGSIIPQILNLITNFILISFLVPDDLGLYEVILTTIALFLTMGDIRINWSIARIVAVTDQSRQKKVVLQVLKKGIQLNSFIGGILAISLVFLAVVAPELPILYNISIQGSTILVIVLALYFIPACLTRVIVGIIHGLRVFRYEALLNILNAVLSLLFIIIILISSGNVIGLIYGKLAAGVLASIIGILVFVVIRKNLFTRNNSKEETTSKITTKSLMAFSLPFYLSGILEFVVIGVDRLILGYFSLNDLGLYKSALFVFSMTIMPIIIITPPAVLVSFLAQNYKVKKEYAINLVLRWTIRVSMLVMFPISIFVFFNAEMIYSTLFKVEYAQGAKLLSILSLCGIFLVFRKSESILALGKPSEYLRFSLVKSFVSISINLALIPIIGGLGAAIGYLATVIAGTTYSILFRRKYELVLFPNRKYFLIYIGALFLSLVATNVVVSLFLNIMNQTFLLVIKGCLYLGIYFSIVYLASGFTEDDIFLLQVVVHKIKRIFDHSPVEET